MTEEYFVCEICKKAATTKGWKKAYRWKTARGFFSHYCYKNETKEEIKETDYRLGLRKDNYPMFSIGDSVFYLKKFGERYRVLRGTIINKTIDGYIIKEELIPKYDVFKTPKEAKLTIRTLEKRNEE